MTRVLHTGDTHLGYQQYHVPRRREDFLEAFRQVAADAIEAEVDAVVHAGDLFHDRRPTLPDLLGAIDVLETLREAEVPFLAIVGNHEGKRDAQWLELFESLGLATRLGDEPVTLDGLAIYGLDFVPRAEREAFAPSFEPHDADQAALVAHGLFEPFDHGEWDPAEILDPSTVEFDAMLLGDNHEPDTAEVDGTWLTYCGSTERASADERAARGYNLVTFDGAVDIARRGLSTREFVFVDVELAAGEGVERVRERVGEHDLADAVVIVNVEGEGEPVQPAAIESFANEEGALVARVTDHREREEETEIEVSFADPDDAVRERVRDLGLSEAARDLDETIRASKVPDSRVADAVETNVRELLEGDAAAFDAAGEGEPADREERQTDGEQPADDRSEAAERDEERTAEDEGAGEDRSEGHQRDQEPKTATEDEGDAADDAADAVSGADVEDASEEQTTEGGDDGSEDQATMEEYL